MRAIEFKRDLVNCLSRQSCVKGILQTGDVNAPLVPGQSDIDLFVLCDSVPDADARKAFYRALGEAGEQAQMNVSNGGVWGYGDIFLVDGIDIMPMYFETREMAGYIEEVLSGAHLNREGRFYPVGRLASVDTGTILYEESGEWTDLQSRTREYPAEFFRRYFAVQAGQILDEEDLGRVLLRKEVLFYHQVLEEAVDHLLQALYAANRRYFPSRKRTEQDVASFDRVPKDFCVRLRGILTDSVREEGIERSVHDLKRLAAEVMRLGA